MFLQSEAYERYMGRWSRQLAPLFVQFAGVAEEESVLDIGSGTGALASAIAAAIPSAHVTGIDPSAAYVTYARERSPDDRIQFQVGDAQRLELPDNAFDRTLSLLVMSFIPDREKALREMIRVTRPGGTIAAAVWDYGEGMEMLRVFWDEAVARDPAVSDERDLPLCRRGELGDWWRVHGLEQVAEQPLVIPMSFTSFDDYWLPFLGGQGPAGGYVVSLPELDRADLERRLRRRLMQDRRDGSIALPAKAWAVKGVVPHVR
jgi:SAM-dependent methyltransferase